MQYPLTMQEETTLNEIIKEIEKLGAWFSVDTRKMSYDSLEIEIDNNNKETWLNILKLAQAANEQITIDWKNDKIGGKTGTKAAPLNG